MAQAQKAVATENASRRAEHLISYLLLLLDAKRGDEAGGVADELREIEALHGERLWLWHPSRMMYGFARLAALKGQAAEAAAFVARGRILFEADVARLGEEVRASLETLPFNRGLLEWV